MASTTPSQTKSANPAHATRSAALKSMFVSLIINGAIPFFLYWVLTTYTSIPQFGALVVSGVPSLLMSIGGIIRQRRIDFLAGLVLIAIAVALIITLLGGDPKIYLIRESFFTITFGLAFLISLMLPRPIMFYVSRHFASGNDPANIARFQLLWQDPRFRRSMRVMSAVWGIGLLLEAALRITLVIVLSVEQFLAVSPFVIYGIIALLTLWTFRYGRTGRIRSAEPPSQEQVATATPTERAE